ncbi:hypothetical protein [Ralstonia pseudosolanacearum]
MNSSQSKIREFWERCIMQTMFVRARFREKHPLYYTETGTLVFDARGISPDEKMFVVYTFAICDLIAQEFGFDHVNPVTVDGIITWQKGGEA